MIQEFLQKDVSTYYSSLRLQQLRYYKVFEKGLVKKPLKPISFDQLHMTYEQIYHIFVQFVQMLFIASQFQQKIFISKALVKVEGQIFFFVIKGWHSHHGFRQIVKLQWQSQIISFFQSLSLINLKQTKDSQLITLFKEWKNWIQNYLSKNISIDIYELLCQMQALDFSKQYSIARRNQNYLIIPKIKGQQTFLKYLNIPQNQQKIQKSKEQTQFSQIIQLLRSLVHQFQQHQLTSHQDAQDSHQTIQQKQTSYYSKHKKREEGISFKLKISRDSQNMMMEVKNVVEEAKKWIIVVIVVEINGNQITIKIKTHPFWKIYGSQFTPLKNYFDQVKIQATKWLTAQVLNYYLFDLMRLELRSGSAEQQSCVSLQQTFRIFPNYPIKMLVIGALQRQLVLWSLFQEYMQQSTKIWMNEPSPFDQEKPQPKINSNLKQKIKSSILMVSKQIQNLIQRE